MRWVEDFLLPAGWATNDEESANAYLVAAGDGGMMQAARDLHDKGKPIVGVNRGTVGFLLNEVREINSLPLNWEYLTLIDLSLIKATFYPKEDKAVTYLAFNDVFCGGDVSDFIRFQVRGSMNGFPERDVRGNGIVLATPQGTTAFILNILGSSAMLPLDSKMWVIGGLGPGPYPNDMVMPQGVTIEVESRDPVNGYADGKRQTVKNIRRIDIQPTDHVVTLGFLQGIDFEARRRMLAQKVERGGM